MQSTRRSSRWPAGGSTTSFEQWKHARVVSRRSARCSTAPTPIRRARAPIGNRTNAVRFRPRLRVCSPTPGRRGPGTPSPPWRRRGRSRTERRQALPRSSSATLRDRVSSARRRHVQILHANRPSCPVPPGATRRPALRVGCCVEPVGARHTCRRWSYSLRGPERACLPRARTVCPPPRSSLRSPRRPRRRTFARVQPVPDARQTVPGPGPGATKRRRGGSARHGVVRPPGDFGVPRYRRRRGSATVALRPPVWRRRSGPDPRSNAGALLAGDRGDRPVDDGCIEASAGRVAERNGERDGPRPGSAVRAALRRRDRTPPDTADRPEQQQRIK